jgi:hypothetical protein
MAQVKIFKSKRFNDKSLEPELKVSADLKVGSADFW